MTKLNLTSNFGSDRLSVRLSSDDHLPRELASPDRGSTRLSIAINTHNPDVFGGYHVNSRLLTAVGAALEKLSLYLVNEEYQSQSFDLPIEPLLAVEKDQPHKIFDPNGQLLGCLMKWQFDTGGGGEFFSDNLIVDVSLPQELAERLVIELRLVCETENIIFQSK